MKLWRYFNVNNAVSTSPDDVATDDPAYSESGGQLEYKRGII